MTLPLRVRVVIIVSAGVANAALYLVSNHVSLVPPRPTLLTSFDEALPFLPWTTAPYFVLLLLGVVLPPLVAQRAAFVTMMTAYVVASALNFAVWLAWPTTMPRPEVPPDTVPLAWLYRALVAIDSPMNALPSGHVTVPLLAVVSVARARPALRIPVICAFALLLPTVLFTKQHAIADVVAGAATAVIGMAIATSIARQRRAPGGRATTT